MRILCLVLLLLFVNACSGVRKASRLNTPIVKENQQVVLHQKQAVSNITYTGCGGFVVEYHDSAIMLDPYFSNVAPLPLVPFKKLKPDTLLMDAFFSKKFGAKKDAEGKIKAILVAHSHYDHLADVPSVFNRNCNPDSTRILGSKSTMHILKSSDLVGDVVVLENDTINSSGDYNWVYTSDHRIRILPVPSSHAPHICGKKLISDAVVESDFTKWPERVQKFPEGENFNYLIDFMDHQKPDSVVFRIFSNAGSACNRLEGYPPKALLAEKDVDVLLLCVASFKQVNGYPEGIVNFVNPGHIILGHWENFFKPWRKMQKKPGTVPGTNVRKFLKRLDACLPAGCAYSLPSLGASIDFYTN